MLKTAEKKYIKISLFMLASDYYQTGRNENEMNFISTYMDKNFQKNIMILFNNRKKNLRDRKR